MSNPVFFCPALDGDAGGDLVQLTGAEGRHAATVRRIRIGEVVDLVDGRGTRCSGPVTATTKQSLTVQVSTRVLEPQPTPLITVVQALAKGDRGELAVELMTEVGVDAIVPWAAARCVVNWTGEREVRSLEKWRRTAQEAAKQARRAWFPQVHDSHTTARVAALSGQVLMLHESAATPLSEVPVSGDVVLVVGPEGGISTEELDTFIEAGATAVRLGSTVLRTSTAGAVAASVISARLGRW